MLERTGHTEASVDLARLAGLTPAGVICEVMNDDGTMARVPDLVPYCERHGLKMVTVADLIAYRRRTEKLVERVVDTALPTDFGDFTAVGYRSLVDDKHHVAMVKGDVDGAEDVLVRVHSECLTGDVFHSMRCDCGEQLDAALAMIEQRGPRRPPLPLPGGPRDRPAQQAPRLQAAGGGRRHGRGQPQARPARRPARLRDRRPDPRRPRPDQHPHPHQQPEEDRRPRGLRPLGHRAGADRVRPQPPQRGLPAGQARQDGPLAAPPGPRPRRGDDPRRGGARRRGGDERGGWLRRAPSSRRFSEEEREALRRLRVRGLRRPLLRGPRRTAAERRPRRLRDGRRAGLLGQRGLGARRLRAALRRQAARHQRRASPASPASASSSAARPTTTTSSAPRPPAASRTCSWRPASPAPSA